jgi:polysaccharide chain length determinant protein (PEP-CTERM system associated)
MKSLVKFYLTLVWRRLPAMLLIVLIVSGIGVAVAVQLPERYSTSARLLVESAQIPGALAASTVQTSAGEQLEVIQQRLMTRANLLEIARKYDVFDDVSSMTPDAIVSEMRRDSTIRTTSGRERATLLSISFEATDARTAADVVNEYVTLILDENIRYRTDRAEGTQDFFEQEVDRLSDQIDIQKDRILRFKQDNSDALPDNLAFRLERQSSLQERISEAQRRKSDLIDQKERLVAVFNTTGSLSTINERALSPEQRQLRELQSQLDASLTIYSETNPKVVLLKTRIAQLESVVKRQTAAGTNDGSEPPSLLAIEVGRIDAEIASLDDVIGVTEGELAEVSESISRTPANAIALEALERDYTNVQGQYNSAVGRLAQAQTGERIELLSKGQRIAVVEQATVPNMPTSPNRPLIAQAGIASGFALAAGLFLLLELLNNAIRRPAELTTALGITPFAVLPYMPTKQELGRRRMIWMVLIIGGVVLVAATLWAVQTYYLPLDLVVTKVLSRLGLTSLIAW